MPPNKEAKTHACAETFHKIKSGNDACDCGAYQSEGSWFEDGMRWNQRRHEAEKAKQIN